MTTTTPMLIYRGKLVSGPAALPRLMLRELIDEKVPVGTERGEAMTTTLRLASNNPNPELTLRLAPPLRVVERIEHATMDCDERARFEKHKAELTRGGGLVSRRFEWCKTWADILEEWDDILWV